MFRKYPHQNARRRESETGSLAMHRRYHVTAIVFSIATNYFRLFYTFVIITQLNLTRGEVRVAVLMQVNFCLLQACSKEDHVIRI
jgi:hypothetical protein